jgi:hypothetical protein
MVSVNGWKTVLVSFSIVMIAAKWSIEEIVKEVENNIENIDLRSRESVLEYQ